MSLLLLGVGAVLSMMPGTADETFEQAHAQIEALEYDLAATLLQEVIVAPDADEKLQIRARVELGNVEVIRGRLAEAQNHYEWALRRDPDFTLPDDEPPKVRNFFEVVKRDTALSESEPETETTSPTPWVAAIGGGAAVVVIAVAIVGAGAATALLYLQSQPSLGVYDERR